MLKSQHKINSIKRILIMKQSELKKLQKKWYKKLEKTGFKDIEKNDKEYSTRYVLDRQTTSQANYETASSSLNHYANCRKFSQHAQNIPKINLLIVELYGNGYNIRQISEYLRHNQRKNKTIQSFLKTSPYKITKFSYGFVRNRLIKSLKHLNAWVKAELEQSTQEDMMLLEYWMNPQPTVIDGGVIKTGQVDTDRRVKEK